jgi:hypothetical protein
MTEPDVRKGMPAVKLDRAEFEKRYRSRFIDPAFKPLEKEIDAIIGAAWDAYSNSRKAPVTRKAGAGFADPDYLLKAGQSSGATNQANRAGVCFGQKQTYAPESIRFRPRSGEVSRDLAQSRPLSRVTCAGGSLGNSEEGMLEQTQ